MKYGYVERTYLTGYDLISPILLTKVGLSSCGHSTFLIMGKQYKLSKFLKKYSHVKIELVDPLVANSNPTICVELRKNNNIFFSNYQILIRPTLSTDLNSNHLSSHEVLDNSFQGTLIKKIFIQSSSCLKTLEILFMNTRPQSIPLVPITLYQVGRLRLSNEHWNEINQLRQNINIVNEMDRIPSYSVSEFEYSLPPTYDDADANSRVLPSYSTLPNNVPQTLVVS